MKKTLFIVLMVLTIALTACSASSAGTPSGSTSSNLPIATQLAVGTLKLNGTDLDITTDQAKDLVVFWETYKQMTQSDTAAQAEFDGLVAQIEETLTADQMQAINTMSITQQDVFASMQGVTTTGSGSSSSTVSALSSSTSASGMPAGGPPADGGGAPPDGGMPSDMGGAASATSTTGQAQSAQASSVQTTTVPTTLVEAVIQSLQQKIAA